MNKFKVGEHVNVYDTQYIGTGKIHSFRDEDANLITVKMDGSERYIEVHYKQCEKLIKEKPCVLEKLDSETGTITRKFILEIPIEIPYKFYISQNEVNE